MAEIPSKCVFEVGADQLRLTTQTNGDQVYIKGVHIDAENSAALAYMINSTQANLKVTIKVAGD